MIEPFFTVMRANGIVNAYRTARDTGVLDAVRSGANVDEIANRCSLERNALVLLLDVLTAGGLVDRAEDVFTISASASLLMDTGYRDVGQEYWDALPDLLVKGIAPLEMRYAEQVRSLSAMVALAAAEASAHLVPCRRVLDVGAGAAPWSRAIAQRDPAVELVLVDRADVLTLAYEECCAEGLDSRVTLVDADAFAIGGEIGEFDLILVANVLHLEPPERSARLLRRVSRLRAHGARIAVIDVFRDDVSLDRSLYGLGLALRSRGLVHERAAVETMLRNAGCSRVHHMPLAAAPGVLDLMVGE